MADQVPTAGSALTEPAVRKALDERIAAVGHRPAMSFLRTGRYQREERSLPIIEHLLGCYPWRDYRYRYGRWQRTQRTFTLNIGPSLGWSKTFDTFQILEAATGRPVAEMVATDCTLSAPSGWLRFAGELGVAGVYLPVEPEATGHVPLDGSAMRLAVSAFADERGALAEAVQLRPGRPITIEGRNLGQQLLASDPRRPWLVDCPGRPER